MFIGVAPLADDGGGDKVYIICKKVSADQLSAVRRSKMNLSLDSCISSFGSSISLYSKLPVAQILSDFQ